MAKFKINYTAHYQASPLSFWVHRVLDNEAWERASSYQPALPTVIVSKGFPILIVDAKGHELQFSSIQEIEHFLEVVKQKNMPTSIQLSDKNSLAMGPNSHWLSRLPAKLKTWRNRQKYIPIVEDGLLAMKQLYIDK